MQADRDRPWLMRTDSGHSSAAASNARSRSNLAKGQTGLSVAFDLPTQTGHVQIVRAAADEDVAVVGLSILSGLHASLVPEIVAELIAPATVANAVAELP